MRISREKPSRNVEQSWISSLDKRDAEVSHSGINQRGKGDSFRERQRIGDLAVREFMKSNREGVPISTDGKKDNFLYVQRQISKLLQRLKLPGRRMVSGGAE